MNTQDHVQSLEAGQALLLREGTRAAVLTHGAVLVQAPARWLAGQVILPAPVRYVAPAMLPLDASNAVIALEACTAIVQVQETPSALQLLQAASRWLRKPRAGQVRHA